MARTHLLIALALTVALPGCAGRKAAWSEDPAADGGGGDGGAATPASDGLKAEATKHWEARTSPESIEKAIASWEQVVAANPKDLDALIGLTRAHYFLADGYYRADEKKYLEIMDKGVSWGEKAMIAASPEFETKMRDGAKYPEAVQSVGKEGVPAMYWYASSLGKWAKKKGFAVLVGQKDNVKSTMDRCLELDPEYFYAGPWRYFGAFYAVAPSFAGGDLNKSVEHFKKSLELQPNYVGTKVLWAAELATKQQDEDTFDKLLNEVLATPDDVIPELKPETIVEKQKARELLAQKDDLF